MVSIFPDKHEIRVCLSPMAFVEWWEWLYHQRWEGKVQSRVDCGILLVDYF